jgi:hypothetical protein
MRPSPHRCQMWHPSPCGQQVWVVPAPATAEVAAQGWQSSLPSPQARCPTSPRGAQGG